MNGSMRCKLGVVVLLMSVIGGAACAASRDGSGPAATAPPSTDATGGEQETSAPFEPACEDHFLGPDPTSSPVLQADGGSVPAQANIYGAGRDVPPQPGGGGAGVSPPVFPLPPGLSRVVTFPSVTGRVNPISHYPDWNGPEGDQVETTIGTHGGPTDVESFLGISGISHLTNGMFLVGVFLTDDEPQNPPPSLDFTGDDEFELAPEIGQVFMIGDGEGRTYAAPDDATRLFLGFADAFLYVGCPGWYGNNSGRVNVTIDVSGG